MAILNLGSLNIDRVFRVRQIARAGETIASQSVQTFAGGKGLNQSIALARAGAPVAHAGKIGEDGAWLVAKLEAEQVDCRRVRRSSQPTGQAVIQVDDAGQNAIVLLGGANYDISPADVDESLVGFGAGDWLLVQNETSAVAYAVARAKQQGLHVAYNPAPFDERARQVPLQRVDLLCVNEIEGAELSGQSEPDRISLALAARWPQAEILLTLGAEGVVYRQDDRRIALPACAVEVVDTTAAGDTFLGYFLAGLSAGLDVQQALEQANRAAALCVARPGASDSIPRAAELSDFFPAAD